MDQFEKTNSEWCGMQKDEMAKRKEDREKREGNADVIRLKGNRKFAERNYKKAIELYEEAMGTTPYKPNILTNLAQCYCKLKNWEEVIEVSELSTVNFPNLRSSKFCVVINLGAVLHESSSRGQGKEC